MRPGSVLQPKFPAPLGMRGVTMMRNMAACLGLLNVATGGRAMAAHSAYVIWYLRGRDDKGELFLLSDGLGVGYGARPTADGNDAVYLVAQENFPSEFLDSVFPVRVLRYAINPDTGGPGRWRGGCGLIREIEVLAPEATVSMRIDSVEHPPWGVAGGHAAGTGRCVVNPGRPDERTLRPLSDGNIVRRGDVVRIETGGGGGWGHPFDREPERVLADVRGGFVSRANAEEHYGVVLAADGLTVDRRGHGRAPRAAAGGQALPPSRLPRGARLMAMPQSPKARVIVGIDTGGTFTDVTLLDPAIRPRLERQDPVDPGRSLARLRQRHRRGAAGRRPHRRRRRARAARHDHCHQPDPGRQGRARRAHHHGRLQVRARDRPPGRAAPRQPVRLGQAETARTARAHLRGGRPHRPRRARAAAARRGRGRAQPRGRSARRASARSPSCCCTATPTPRTSGASPPSSPRRCPDALVSLSSEVLPVFREYERSMTTILNASVMPVVAAYVARLDARIAEQGHRGAAAADEVERRGDQHAHRAARARGDGAVRPGSRRGRRGLRRRRLRAQEPDRHRHRRHLGRHQPDPRRRARPHHHRPRRQLADRPADDRHRHHRRGRRLDRARVRYRAR